MIISLVAVLMLLCDETIEENEVDWFFKNGGSQTNNEKFETQFLGWKMGSGGETTSKDNGNSQTPPEISTVISDNSKYELLQSEQLVESSPSWKTLIFDDSTIHYIPLEEMASVRPSLNSFISEDALDPFYLDADSQGDSFNNQLINNLSYFYKVHTQRPQHLRSQKQHRFANINSKNVFKNTLILGPMGLSFQNKVIPNIEPNEVPAVHVKHYNRNHKIETGLPPEGRHTMFVHPRLLDMMKAMDRSILTYPSKFQYKSLDQFPVGGKRLPSQFYNKMIII